MEKTMTQTDTQVKEKNKIKAQTETQTESRAEAQRVCVEKWSSHRGGSTVPVQLYGLFSAF